MFTYRLSWHYHFGRLVFAACIIFFGYNVLAQSRDFYVPYLHAWRRMLLPESKNRINASLTFEEAFDYTIQAVGFLMIFGGALLALNKRVPGGLICLLALTFLLVTQDNPFLVEYIKPKPKVEKIRYDDLARHLSLIGAILFLMVVPPVEDLDPEKDHLSKKAKKEKKDN